MSLYNNVSDSLLSKGVFGSIKSGIDSALGGAASKVTSALGGSAIAQRATGAIQSAATQAAKRAIDKHVPYALKQKIETAGGIAGSILQGDYEGAVLRGMDGGLFDGLLGSLSGFSKQEAARQRPTPMFGGVSLAEAQRVHNEVMQAKHSRKNLFFIEITSYAEGDITRVFNLMCVDVDYSPFQVRGEKKYVGGAAVDGVQGQEAVEMRFTTYDTTDGELKRFFARHHAMCAARDGTVGLPAQYALHIKIVDGVVGGGNLLSTTTGGYTDEGLFRVQSLEKSMSRREQALQELQLTFSQLDTFMKP